MPGHRAHPSPPPPQRQERFPHPALSLPAAPSLDIPVARPGQGLPAVSSQRAFQPPGRVVFPGARLTPEPKPRGQADVRSATLPTTPGQAQGTATLPAPYPSEDSGPRTGDEPGAPFLQDSRAASPHSAPAKRKVTRDSTEGTGLGGGLPSDTQPSRPELGQGVPFSHRGLVPPPRGPQCVCTSCTRKAAAQPHGQHVPGRGLTS